MTTPENAFQDLAAVFSSRDNQVLEIEIIPSGLGSSVLQDGCSIGITKKGLVQAFTIARQLFMKRLLPMSDDDFQVEHLEKETDSTSSSDLVITEIMLLFDCEHLTACNWRKRRLLAAVSHCLRVSDQVLLTIRMLETELTLMTSYQCSPLHRHTKSPTLWSHRLWVLGQLSQIRTYNTQDLLKLARAELDIVLRAGELHPKNYYAFNYMRQLHLLLAHIPTDVKDRASWTVELARILINPTLDWCLAHPRDISGWAFEKYLLEQVPQQQIRAENARRALRFARDVGWEGESLWTFVDQTVRHFDMETVVDDVLRQEKDGPKPEYPVSQPGASNWPWKTRLAKAKSYWASYGQSNVH
ncbi:Protein prenyltransferase [Penicillium maclennaniae]|uniref:Protein prenyltransferase n=1 Tax=Penicillium maclennaniae TaxID=1343394 RepID=UPI00254000EA|nr:Protein prenyltransferase [Penicillium maclennaniae]KAJ5665657.1 Protein prenyltransferase [Penicillium maclennaniae]